MLVTNKTIYSRKVTKNFLKTCTEKCTIVRGRRTSRGEFMKLIQPRRLLSKVV